MLHSHQNMTLSSLMVTQINEVFVLFWFCPNTLQKRIGGFVKYLPDRLKDKVYWLTEGEEIKPN